MHDRTVTFVWLSMHKNYNQWIKLSSYVSRHGRMTSVYCLYLESGCWWRILLGCKVRSCWTCASMSNQSGIWGIWRPCQALELLSRHSCIVCVMWFGLVVHCPVLHVGVVPLPPGSAVTMRALGGFYESKHPHECKDPRFSDYWLARRCLVHLFHLYPLSPHLSSWDYSSQTI